jgi:5'(3')-deoxyribonucleotidase
MSRNRILVDVDGVLADFSQHVLNKLRVSTKMTTDEVTQWDIFSLLEQRFSPYHKKMALAMMDDMAFWKSLPVMAGAQAGVQALRDNGYEVVFVTSPWDTCVGWNVARNAWLKQHFGASPRDVVITHCKYLVHGHTLIDDRESHVEEWNSRHAAPGAMLFGTAYNQDAPFLRWCWPKIVRALCKEDTHTHEVHDGKAASDKPVASGWPTPPPEVLAKMYVPTKADYARVAQAIADVHAKTFRLVETDNFDRDYPFETWASECAYNLLSEANHAADELNLHIGNTRFVKVVKSDYTLDDKGPNE